MVVNDDLHLHHNIKKHWRHLPVAVSLGSHSEDLVHTLSDHVCTVLFFRMVNDMGYKKKIPAELVEWIYIYSTYVCLENASMRILKICHPCQSHGGPGAYPRNTTHRAGIHTGRDTTHAHSYTHPHSGAIYSSQSACRRGGGRKLQRKPHTDMETALDHGLDNRGQKQSTLEG